MNLEMELNILSLNIGISLHLVQQLDIPVICRDISFFLREYASSLFDSGTVREASIIQV